MLKRRWLAVLVALALVLLAVAGVAYTMVSSSLRVEGYTLVMMDYSEEESAWRAHHIESGAPFLVTFAESQSFLPGQVIQVEGPTRQRDDGTWLVLAQWVNTACGQTLPGPDFSDPIILPSIAALDPVDQAQYRLIQGEIVALLEDGRYELSVGAGEQAIKYCLVFEGGQLKRGQRLVIVAKESDKSWQGLAVIEPLDLWPDEAQFLADPFPGEVIRTVSVQQVDFDKNRVIEIEIQGKPRINELHISFRFRVESSAGVEIILPRDIEFLHDVNTELQTLLFHLPERASQFASDRWVLEIWPTDREDEVYELEVSP